MGKFPPEYMEFFEFSRQNRRELCEKEIDMGEEKIEPKRVENSGKMETTLEKELGFCFGSETSKEGDKEGKLILLYLINII